MVPTTVPTAVVPTTPSPFALKGSSAKPTTVPTAVVPTTSLVNPLAPPNSAPAPDAGDDVESPDSTLLVVGVVAVLLVAWLFWR